MREPSGSGRAVLSRLLLNGKLHVSGLSVFTGLPTWKVSRLLKHFELEGLVCAEIEAREVRGRPKKFFTFTEAGIDFFTGRRPRGAGDENGTESSAPHPAHTPEGGN